MIYVKQREQFLSTVDTNQVHLAKAPFGLRCTHSRLNMKLNK